MADSLTAIAQHLYGLVPADFTAQRNARARDLKPTDAALAKQVAALRRPSPAAWAVNLIARERADRLEALLRLGEQMRQAQERFDREELRRLGTERREGVAGLAREAAELAQAAGHPPSASVLGEVEQTLQAATSDPEAAAAVAAGLLVRALRAVGFEPVDLLDAVAVPGAAPAPAPASKRSSAESPPPVQLHEVRRRKEARREAERLEAEAAAAAADLEALDRRAHRLEVRRQNLVAETVELREQLQSAEAALEVVDQDARGLADERARAEAEADASSRRARDARADADALQVAD